MLGLGLICPRTAVSIDALRMHIRNIRMQSRVTKVIKIVEEKIKVESRLSINPIIILIENT